MSNIDEANAQIVHQMKRDHASDTPPRLRNVTLLSIHSDIRQELDRHKRAMDELSTRLKNHVDEMLRANG